MSETPRRDWLELFAMLLLAFAAVATAWSSYQSTRWSGEQAKAASRTNAIRIDAARAREDQVENGFLNEAEITAKINAALPEGLEVRRISRPAAGDSSLARLASLSSDSANAARFPA